jgi:hypothetical protein
MGRGVMFVASLVVALLPAFAALPIAFSERPGALLPWTDHAVLELQVRQATESLLLVGPYSRFEWHHPGPFYFYLLAPAYALSGHATSAIWATVWTLNALCLTGIVWLVHRAGGPGHALLTAVLLALQTRLLGVDKLCDPWNPIVIVLPFELLVFASAAVGAGNPRLLPLVALAASFVVQTHVGTAPAAAALVFAAAAMALLRLRGRSARSGWAEWRRGAAISAGVTAVVWAPVVYEQISAPTGNLTKLVRFFASQSSSHAFLDASAAVSRHFSSVAHLDPAHRILSNTSFVHPLSNPALGTMGAMLAMLVLPLVFGRLRRDAYAVSGASVALVGTAVATFACTRVVGPLMSYLFIWTTGLGTLCAALVAAEAGAWLLRGLERLRSRPSSSKVGAWCAVAVALLVSANALRGAMRELRPAPYYYGQAPASDVTVFSAAIAEHIRSRRWTRPLIRIAEHERWAIVAGVLLALSKQAIPIYVEDEWLFMFGSKLRVPGKPDGVIVFGNRPFEEGSSDARAHVLLAEHAGTFLYVRGSR